MPSGSTGHWSPRAASRSYVTPAKSGVSSAISPHHVLRLVPRQLVPEPLGDELADVEVGLRRSGRVGRRVDELDAALGVRERPGLLEEGRGREDHVRELCRLVLEDLLDDEELEVAERGHHVLHVGIGLDDVVAADPHRLELALDRGVEHLRHLQSALALHRHAPALLEHLRRPRRPRPSGRR